MMESLKKLFTSNGRVGRLEFVRFILLFFIIILAIPSVIVVMDLYTEETSILFSFLTLPLIILVILSVLITIRRLHDIDCTGWWFFIKIIPLVNVIFYAVLLFKKGTEGNNKYGDQPQTINCKLFVIILTIFISSIILSAHLLPKYDLMRAKKGDAIAQNNLGIAYLEGNGVEQNDAEAFKWLKLAADQGEATAQLNLASLYSNGQGVTQDHVQAFKWLKLAAEQGNAIAQNNLGVAYLEGDGVEQNDAEAFKWFKLAADQGVLEAKDALKELEK